MKIWVLKIGIGERKTCEPSILITQSELISLPKFSHHAGGEKKMFRVKITRSKMVIGYR